MPDVVMPRLSDSMEEGTILKWLKAEGDDVAKGDELVEIETDKATMTYEADAAGTLAIVAEEGSTLAIGEVIARIGEGDGASAGAGAEGRSEQEAGGGESDGDGAAPAATAEREDESETAAEADAGEGGDGDGDQAGAEAQSGEGDAGDEADGAAAEADSDEGEDEEAGAEADSDEDGEAEAGQKAAAAEEAPPADGNGGRPKASPVARRIARERGVDLSALEGSGPGGRIVKADVEAAASGGAAKAKAEAEGTEEGRAEPAEAEAEAETPAEAEPEKAADRKPAPAPDAQTGRGEVTVHEPTRIQQLIARRMAESKATIPHFTLSTDVDMVAAVELRSTLKELSEAQEKPAPSYNDMVVKASAIALRDFPLANGSYRDGRFELYGRVNIGVAVAAEESLVVPTIFDADRKGLGQIAEETRALAEKVREGRITPPELSGGTFSITNLGMYGVEHFTAVVNPPQAAILAVGKLEERPVVHDGEVVARARMTLTISCDHRILYGAPAAQFLARIKAILEQPISLAL
jgi:pyruvate dehydrogenase E2 component (dihydrolipoamide acetyltransferase)